MLCRIESPPFLLLFASFLTYALAGRASLELNLKPEDVTVTADYLNPINLECEVNETLGLAQRNGSYLKQYWTKDGNPIINHWQPPISNGSTAAFFDRDIVSSDGIYIINNTTLFVGTIIPEKEGMYACTARLWNENNELLVENRSTTPIFIAKLDEFFVEPNDVERDEGSSVTLTCISGASIPPANITWFKSEEAVERGIQMNQIVQLERGAYKTTSTLEIRNVSSEDHGEYSCIAVNNLLPSETKVSRSALLKIRGKPSMPSIIVQPASVYAVEGNPSRFTCVCNGEPTPEISWYFNQVKIDLDVTSSPQDSDISIENFGHTSILVIKVTDSATTGQYMCSAQNNVGLVESHKAELQIASFSWNFIQEPTPAEVIKGSAVTLLCRPPLSQPPAQVHWFKDNHPIDISNHNLIMLLSSGDLYFNKIDLKDDGEYFCNAVNVKLEKTATSRRAKLTVFAPPTFNDVPDSVDITIEHTARLDCNTVAAPRPEVHWFKNGQRVVPEERLVLGFGNQTLFIVNAMRSDRAFYNCRASNSYGEAESKKTLLNVNVPPVIYAEVPDNELIDLNTSHIITCMAIGEPTSQYKWTHDGVPLNISGDSRFSLVNDGLKISPVLERDSGDYNCTAFSKAGTAWSSGTINVKISAKVISAPLDDTVNEYSDASFSCQGRGYPEITYRWVIDESNRTAEGKIDRMISYHDGGTTITVKNVTDVMHDTHVTCIVENFWSSSNATADLNVLTLPVIKGINVSELSPITPGSKLTLLCIAEGRKQPRIKWYHTFTQPEEDSLSKSIKKTLVSTNSAKLVLDGISNSDEGTYTCTADNSVGSVSQSVEVQVLDRPDNPINVSAETVDERSIRVTWTSPDFIDKYITSYQIHHSPPIVNDDGSTRSYVNVTAFGSERETVVHSLKPATKYIMKVAAVNKAGVGKWSAFSTALTFPDAPTEPTSITMHDITASSLGILWQKPGKSNGELSKYMVEYRKVDPIIPSEPVTLEIPVTNFQSVLFKGENVTLSDLDPYSSYVIKVKAGTWSNNKTILWGPYSFPISVKTRESFPSKPPTNILVQVKSTTSMVISWKKIPREFWNGVLRGYRIEVFDVMKNGTKEIIVNKTKVSYYVTDLSPGRTYKIKLTGFTSIGNGKWSPTIEKETFPAAPSGAPLNFSVRNITATSAVLSWEQLDETLWNGPGLTYTVQLWSNKSNEDWKEFSSLADNSLFISELFPWTVYLVRIRACNKPSGPGPFSPSMEFTTSESAPGPCSNVIAIAISPSMVNIQWNAPVHPNGNLIGYLLTYSSLTCLEPEFQIDFDSQICVPVSTTTLPVRSFTDEKLWHKFKSSSLVDQEKIFRELQKTLLKNVEFSLTTNSDLVDGTPTPELSYLPIVGNITEIVVEVSTDGTVVQVLKLLQAATVYRVTVQAMNYGELGDPSVVLIATDPLTPPTTVPTTPQATTAVRTTEITSYAAMPNESTSPQSSVSEINSDIKQSALIAGTTAGALFISIGIALIAASKYCRSKKAKPKLRNFLVPSKISFVESASPIIPTNVSPIFGLTDDKIEMWDNATVHKGDRHSPRHKPMTLQTFTGMTIANNNVGDTVNTTIPKRTERSPSNSGFPNEGIRDEAKVVVTQLPAETYIKSSSEIYRNEPVLKTLSDCSLHADDFITTSSISCSSYDSTLITSSGNNNNTIVPSQIKTTLPVNGQDRDLNSLSHFVSKPPQSNLDDVVLNDEECARALEEQEPSSGDRSPSPIAGHYYPYGLYNTNNNQYRNIDHDSTVLSDSFRLKNVRNVVRKEVGNVRLEEENTYL